MSNNKKHAVDKETAKTIYQEVAAIISNHTTSGADNSRVENIADDITALFSETYGVNTAPSKPFDDYTWAEIAAIAEHRIYNEDCLEGMKRIPDKSVDMVLCGLPYGCGKTNHKWDREIDLAGLWKEYERLLKPDGIVCLFGNEPFTSKLIQSNMDMFRYKMVWEKESPTGFLNSNYKPLSLFEDIVVFSKGTVGSKSKLPIRYYPQGLIQKEQIKRNRPNSTWRSGKGYGGNNKLNSDTEYVTHYANYPTDILKFSRDRNAVHPTQKPVALFEYLIHTYTNEGELVLDNCIGSGTTAIACINTGRNFIGFELDKQYCDIANERIQKALAERRWANGTTQPI